jgi:hypothetical protein
MKDHSDSVGQPLRRGDPQIPVNGANQLVAKFSRLYAEADPEDQFALRVWMRDIILGRKEGRVNMLHARRSEKRMIEACERRILEFPLDMDARDVAKELNAKAGMLGRQKYCCQGQTRAGKSGKLSKCV